MAQYSKSIASGNHKYEFWFTEITEPASVRVYITVEDVHRRLISFNMRRNDHKNWKIVESTEVPQWILSLEAELSQCIDDSLPEHIQAKKKLK